MISNVKLFTSSGATIRAKTSKMYGDTYRTKLTLTGSTFSNASSAALGSGIDLGTFPKGIIRMKKAAMYLSLTTTTATVVVPYIGLGTVVASGAVSVLNGTTTFHNWVREFLGTAVGLAATAVTTYAGGPLASLAAAQLTSPGASTTDYAMQGTNAGAHGFAVAAEGDTFIDVVTSLQKAISGIDGSATASHVFLNIATTNGEATTTTTAVVGTVSFDWEFMGTD